MLNGDKLAFLRSVKGYSQVYVARCIGVCEKTISEIERGKFNLSEENYKKYIKAINGQLKPIKTKEEVDNNKPKKKSDDKRQVKETNSKK